MSASHDSVRLLKFGNHLGGRQPIGDLLERLTRAAVNHDRARLEDVKLIRQFGIRVEIDLHRHILGAHQSVHRRIGKYLRLEMLRCGTLRRGEEDKKNIRNI